MSEADRDPQARPVKSQQPTQEPSPSTPTKDRPGMGIKAPLIFSAVLGLVAGVIVTITSTGGLNNPDHPLRIDLGLIAFGVCFIVSLLLVALLQLSARDNPDHLSKGSGINRSSEQMHWEAMAKARAKAQASQTGQASGSTQATHETRQAPEGRKPHEPHTPKGSDEVAPEQE